jgi:hypothetical protein
MSGGLSFCLEELDSQSSVPWQKVVLQPISSRRMLLVIIEDADWVIFFLDSTPSSCWFHLVHLWIMMM